MSKMVDHNGLLQDQNTFVVKYVRVQGYKNAGSNTPWHYKTASTKLICSGLKS